MKSQGTIIRLIDVVLIILIGFAIIADLTVRTQMLLPESWRQTLEEQSADSLTVLLVRVDGGGIYQLKFLDASGKTADFVAFQGADTLAAVLDRLRTQAHSLAVAIQPADSASLQTTVDVVDICEHLGIPKSLEL